MDWLSPCAILPDAVEADEGTNPTIIVQLAQTKPKRIMRKYQDINAISVARTILAPSGLKQLYG